MLDLPNDDAGIGFSWMQYAPVDLRQRDWLPNRCYASQLSALVYKRNINQAVLEGLGYSEYDFFNIEATQVAVAVHARQKHALVIYEGTTERADWLRNFKFGRVAIPINGRVVKIHRGFHEAGSKVDSKIQPLLKKWRTKGFRIYVMGHSQGAALALRLALFNMDYVDGVYRIAPPRLGNAALNDVVAEAPFYTVSLGSFFDSVTWSPPYPFYRRERDAILLDPSRDYVTEVRGLRESWAVIIRWFYLIAYTARLGGLLLMPQTWWMIPDWWKNIRRLWKDHGAQNHYAAQTQRLVYAAINRGDYSTYGDKPVYRTPP